MKENDSDLRFELDIAKAASKAVSGQGVFANLDVSRIAKQVSAAGSVMRDMALALEKSSVFAGYSKMMEDLTAASRAIAFQNKPLFEAIALNTEQLHNAFAKMAPTFEPFCIAMAETGSRFRSQLELHSSFFDGAKIAIDQSWLKDVTSRMADIARLNFALPEIALTHWPQEVILDRAPLLRDCILNTSALEIFHTAAMQPDSATSPESVTLATDFVFEQAEIVRRLPPRLDDLQNIDECRLEEIGSKLEIALRDIDRRLVDLRRRAWANLAGGVAGARLAMVGIREVFDHVLRTFAPDSKIKALPVWENRTDRNLKGPTRAQPAPAVDLAVRAIGTILEYECHTGPP